MAPQRNDDLLAQDFRNMLWAIWMHLGLPEPTPAQYLLAQYLQHGSGDQAETGRNEIIMGFRGIGKSYITAAYVLWRLYRDPVNEKILVISASSVRSKEFVSQVKAIMNTMDVFEHLRPSESQRDMMDRFDVRGASISQSPSVKSAGITGQVTGSRATLICADDIEISTNSRTEESRALLLNSVMEFESIRLPGADVIYLGTPQSFESIYHTLVRTRNYRAYCIPARYPTPDKIDAYRIKTETGREVETLAPWIQEALAANPRLAGKPTDPKRFNEEDLLERESKGRQYFQLQFNLDPTLSDAERYPLKQHDLIVMGVNAMKAPMTVQWGRDKDKRNYIHDIPNVGFSGDYLLGPLFVDSEWREYDGSVCFVDPAGRGKDETGWTILKWLKGMLFVCKVGGHNGSPEESMWKIATDAKAYNVNLVLVEPNYAGTVWIAAFLPILLKVWPGVNKKGQPDSREVGGCTVEEAEWSKAQKEVRIIDTLEPAMTTHRLVVDESVARDEVLMYQLTHITRERGSLTHDDRLDSLAGAVDYAQKALSVNPEQARREQLDEEMDDEIEDFLESAKVSVGGVRTGRVKGATAKERREGWYLTTEQRRG